MADRFDEEERTSRDVIKGITSQRAPASSKQPSEEQLIEQEIHNIRESTSLQDLQDMNPEDALDVWRSLSPEKRGQLEENFTSGKKSPLEGFMMSPAGDIPGGEIGPDGVPIDRSTKRSTTTIPADEIDLDQIGKRLVEMTAAGDEAGARQLYDSLSREQQIAIDTEARKQIFGIVPTMATGGGEDRPAPEAAPKATPTQQAVDERRKESTERAEKLGGSLAAIGGSDEEKLAGAFTEMFKQLGDQAIATDDEMRELIAGLQQPGPGLLEQAITGLAPGLAMLGAEAITGEPIFMEAGALASTRAGKNLDKLRDQLIKDVENFKKTKIGLQSKRVEMRQKAQNTAAQLMSTIAAIGNKRSIAEAAAEMKKTAQRMKDAAKKDKLPSGTFRLSSISGGKFYKPSGNLTRDDITLSTKDRDTIVKDSGNVDKAIKSMNTLFTSVNAVGTELFPTKYKKRMEGAIRNLIQIEAGLGNFGVLQPAELKNIEKFMADPTSAGKNIMFGGRPRALIEVLQEVEARYIDLYQGKGANHGLEIDFDSMGRLGIEAEGRYRSWLKSMGR